VSALNSRLILLAGVANVELRAFHDKDRIQVEFDGEVDYFLGQFDHFMNDGRRHALKGQFVLGKNKRVNFFLNLRSYLWKDLKCDLCRMNNRRCFLKGYRCPSPQYKRVGAGSTHTEPGGLVSPRSTASSLSDAYTGSVQDSTINSHDGVYVSMVSLLIFDCIQVQGQPDFYSAFLPYPYLETIPNTMPTYVPFTICLTLTQWGLPYCRLMSVWITIRNWQCRRSDFIFIFYFLFVEAGFF
jgi:hypothetical protein